MHNKFKTICKRGHILPSQKSKSGRRRCRICDNIRNKKYRNPLGNISPSQINKEKIHCKYGHLLPNVKNKEGKRICKECKRLLARELRRTQAHKDYQSNWKKENPQKTSGYSKKWRQKNPNYFKEYDKTHPEQYKQRQKKHEKKPERKQYHRDWSRNKYKNNPEFRAEVSRRSEEYRLKFPRSSGETPQEFEAKNLRRALDENRCQYVIDDTGVICGVKHSKKMWVQVHHIKPKSQYPELMADIDNLMTVCIFHHGLDHFNKGQIREAILIWNGFIKRTSKRHKWGQKTLVD